MTLVEKSTQLPLNTLADKQARRRFRLLIIYLLLLSPWILNGALAALQPTANSPLDWVDSAFAPRHEYDQFAQRFVPGDVVVISWPGCVLDNTRIDNFTNCLRRSRVFFENEQWMFDRVVSGRDMLKTFTSPPLSLSANDAKSRISRSLIGPDGNTTAVVIAFNQIGLKRRGKLVPLIRTAAYQIANAPYEQQHLAGPIIDGYEVDVASHHTASRLAPLSSLIVFCVCILCLHSLHAATLVFGNSCICQAIALAVMNQCGAEMTALLIVLPPLIQVLAVAGGIHFINYYFESGQESSEYSVRAALRVGWLPSVLSSTTTAIGLGSLAVSGLAVVREFGIFAAIGVISTLATLLVLLPGIIDLKPIRYRTVSDLSYAKPWQLMLTMQRHHAGFIAFVGIASMILLGLGVSRLKTSVRIETLFGANSRLAADYNWIEEHVGPMVPIEVVVRFATFGDLTASKLLQKLEHIKDTLQSDPDVRATTNCTDFMPPLTGAQQSISALQYLSAIEPAIRNAGYMQSDSDGTCLRFTAHTSAVDDQNYGAILSRIQNSMKSATITEDASRIKAIEISGLMPLVHEIQRQLLYDLFSSFLTAFLLIAIVMTIVQAGFISGLITMIPNVFPSLALFGILGWLNVPVDIGSVMTASIAMGIAVDDTLHFLNYYRRSLDSGYSQEDAILQSYKHCGKAMIQTTLVCGAGLAVFALSDFLPTARFAWMMLALLGSALVGDLVLLPALLLNPLGRMLERRNQVT